MLPLYSNGTAAMPDSPKVFISYSWTTPSHEEWVLDLATALVQNGIDVILDKWHLKEGQDVTVFMEQIGRGSDLTKVLMICDRGYVSKSNARTGGVGIEAQIITSEIYNSSTQTKFVAVVAEYTDDDNPCIPIFYAKRKYIDLSSIDRYNKEFETLLRWIFDKPLYVRPELGSPPVFLSDDPKFSVRTTGASRNLSNAIRVGKPNVIFLLEDYLAEIASDISLMTPKSGYILLDEEIFVLINNSLPLKNEYISTLKDVIRYLDESQYGEILRKFLESLLNLKSMYCSGRQEGERDAIKFVAHEIFLATIALLLHREKFSTVSLLLTSLYYISPQANSEGRIETFVEFRDYLETFSDRTKRLHLQRLSLHADLLERFPIILRHSLQRRSSWYTLRV